MGLRQSLLCIDRTVLYEGTSLAKVEGTSTVLVRTVLYGKLLREVGDWPWYTRTVETDAQAKRDTTDRTKGCRRCGSSTTGVASSRKHEAAIEAAAEAAGAHAHRDLEGDGQGRGWSGVTLASHSAKQPWPTVALPLPCSNLRVRFGTCWPTLPGEAKPREAVRNGRNSDRPFLI